MVSHEMLIISYFDFSMLKNMKVSFREENCLCLGGKSHWSPAFDEITSLSEADHNYCNPIYTLRCVVKYIIAKIQSGTAIFLFPGGQESSINSPYVPRTSLIARLLNVIFRLLLHLAAVL